jgi:hypothetical protein
MQSQNVQGAKLWSVIEHAGRDGALRLSALIQRDRK